MNVLDLFALTYPPPEARVYYEQAYSAGGAWLPPIDRALLGSSALLSELCEEQRQRQRVILAYAVRAKLRAINSARYFANPNAQY